MFVWVKHKVKMLSFLKLLKCRKEHSIKLKKEGITSFSAALPLNPELSCCEMTLLATAPLWCVRTII